MKNNCLFCAMAAGEIPCFKIYEDENFFAILDINPASSGHTLVIPKAHYPDFTETPDEVIAEAAKVIKKVSAKLCAALNADGFNLLQNNGEAAGQTVKHIHFHIIPRKNGDAIKFEGEKTDMDGLSKLAEKIT
jgi:histidine triad (HIT) family protein